MPKLFPYSLLLLLLLLLPSRCKTPKQFDWRNQKVVTPVKNQGSCSAGWAFASTSAYETFLLRVDQTGGTIDLSQQYVIQCSNQGDCSGCRNIRKTMNFIRDNGIPYQTDLPYQSKDYTQGKAQINVDCQMKTVKWGSKVTNRAFYETSSGRLKNLVHKGVMVVGINANQELRQNYKGGVYKCKDHGHYNHSNQNYNAQEPWVINQLNHYVMLVGYDANTNFIYKNSFGKEWGNDGYGTFEKNYDCGIRIVSYEFYAARVVWGMMVGVLLVVMGVEM